MGKRSMYYENTSYDPFLMHLVLSSLTFVCIFGRTNCVILGEYEWEIRSIYDENTSRTSFGGFGP